MNALFNSARVALPRASTFSQVRKVNTAQFKKDFDVKHWLSDAGAYPVMGVCIFACTFCAARIVHSAGQSDVRITPENRSNLIRKTA